MRGARAAETVAGTIAETGDEPPLDYGALRAAIVARRDTLPKRLAQVAAYTVDHPDEIAFGTAASIAAEAAVQPSTLIRFAQAMGYQGFTDLQAVFRRHLRGGIRDYDQRLAALSGEASGPALLLDRFCEAGERSIAAFRRGADGRAVEALVDVLAKARTIHLVGVRRSFPVVFMMAYAFGKLSVRHRLVDFVGGIAERGASQVERGDAVFAVSFAPYAEETIGFAAAAARARVPVVAVTDGPFSPLAEHAKPFVEVAEADVEGFRSLSATLALAMTITVAVGERRRGR